MKSNTIVKQITFPKGLLENAEIKADLIGVSITEYIRYLVINDTKDMLESASSAVEDSIRESYRNIDHGEFSKLSSDADIDEFLDKDSDDDR